MMNPKRRMIELINEQIAQEYLRLQNRLRGEPEPDPEWPFVLTQQDERFLRINRIAR